MTRQPRRVFTLLDAIVLVAATAVGLAWVRTSWYFENFDWPDDWLEHPPKLLGSFLLTWTIATLVLRLIPPRPPLRRVFLQPGTAACAAVVFVFAIHVLSYLGSCLARNRGIPWYVFRRGGGAGAELFWEAILSGTHYHLVVMSVWGLLLLVRRLRPEPSWIDRAGRALGLFWILLALWSWSYSVIEQWREGPILVR